MRLADSDGTGIRRRLKSFMAVPKSPEPIMSSLAKPQILVPVLLACFLALAHADEPRHQGSLVIVGGGRIPNRIRDRFMTLAGEKTANLVIIPTASESADRKEEEQGYLEPWRHYSPASLTLLHTRSRAMADEPAFVKPLADATAVWLDGGDQTKLVAAYRGTAVERELRSLLKRGGVIGGTSAGAAVMSDVMIEGGNPKPAVGRGFGFIANAVVDQHFLKRNRMNRLLEVLATRPNLIGIGVDEETAFVLEGETWSVVGRSYVIACEVDKTGKPLRFATLSDGDRGTYPSTGLPAVSGRSTAQAPGVPKVRAQPSHRDGAPDPRLWGSLVPGPHSVGFTRSWQLDHARQYAPAFHAEHPGPVPPRECPRPILVSLWYPARSSPGAPMRYRDYLEIGSDDPLIAPFAKRLDAFTRRTIAEEWLEVRPAKIDEIEEAGLQRWLDAATYAQKEAPVAPGRFPLIVAHPGLGGTFEDNAVFYEYVASHGYVVIVAPYQAENPAYLNIDWDLDRSIKDMDFLVRYAKGRPDLNLGAIGAIGHSYGAQAVLAWRAENNSPLGAVVSLDSTVDHNAVDEPGFAPPKLRLVNPNRLAGPILMYATKEDEPEFLAHWAHLKYTRLYTATVSGVEHNDYITQGAARFAYLPGRRVPAEKATAIRAQYDRVCQLTREFFDAYLKGDEQAELSLKRAAHAKTESANVALAIHEPLPLPPTAGQLLDLAHRQGFDAAIQLVKRFGTEMAEETLQDTSSELWTEGKRDQARAFSLLHCQLFPSSWVAQKVLADLLLEEADRAGALAGYRRAQDLIAAGGKPTPSKRARKAIADGVKKAEGK
jgi:cyanophycinase